MRTAPRKETPMETMGRAATVVVALALLAGLVIGVQSLPDIKRYLRMRQM